MKYTLLVFLGLLATMLKADVATFLNGWSLSQGTSVLPLNNASGVRQYNYRIQTSGTYRITTNGKPVDASICIVMKNNATEDLNVTLILDQCHLAPTSQSVVTSSDSDYTHYTIAPIVIDRPKNKGYKTNLKILFEGENALIARSEVGSYAAVWHSAITAAPAKGFTQDNPLKVAVEIARAPWAKQDESSLTLAGRTSLGASPATPYAPIYFPTSFGESYAIDATVELGKGDFVFLTSEGSATSNPLISPLVEATHVRLEGADINAVVASSVISKSNGLCLQDVREGAARCKLFNATTVIMDGGEVRSVGGASMTSTPMVSAGSAYTSQFIYPDELLVLPGMIKRGIVRLRERTQVHGLLLKMDDVIDFGVKLSTCFIGTPTTSETPLVVEMVGVEGEQVIEVNAPDATMKFVAGVVDVEQELNASELFELPLEPTLEGFAALDFYVGFDRFQLDVDGVWARFKLMLPAAYGVEKEYHLTVRATSGETQQVVYDAPVIFRDEEASGIYQVDLQMPAAYPLITFPRGTIYYQMSLSECRD